MSAITQRPVAYSPKGEPYYSAKQMRMTYELGRRSVEQAERQELVSDSLIRSYVNSLIANKPDEAADATKRMVDYVFDTPPTGITGERSE